VTLLKTYFPDCAVTADLIVGFPGETDEEFNATLAFIRKCAFSSMHVFPFSRRPGRRPPTCRIRSQEHPARPCAPRR
jgi:threonylcarbamoyladenosine tRNA methylthiotransferase MtaB